MPRRQWSLLLSPRPGTRVMSHLTMWLLLLPVLVVLLPLPLLLALLQQLRSR